MSINVLFSLENRTEARLSVNVLLRGDQSQLMKAREGNWVQNGWEEIKR